MTGLFGPLQVTIEPWAAEYGPQWRGGAPPEEAEVPEALDVEVPLARWAPIAAGAAIPWSAVAFVDGVRRIDAFVAISADDRMTRGAFGTYAAGTVVLRGGAATFGPAVIGRAAVCGDGLSLPGPVTVMRAVTYEPASAPSADPPALVHSLETRMRVAEERLARELADAPGALVLADGPLAFVERSKGATVGYVKSIEEWHLPAEAVRLVHSLPPGARSPLAVLQSGRRIRYTWFLRVAPPWPGDAPFAGIVRLEVSQAVGLDAARRLADGCAVFLPRLAPPRGTDPRAPSNLLPIGAIERHLRHRMGDPRLIHRGIQTLIVREAVHRV